MKVKNYFFVLIFLLTGVASNAQCNNCNDSSNVIIQNSNGDFVASSAQAYFWEICEGNATISGSNINQTVSVNCSKGTFKIKVTRFVNGNCIESCETYTCGDSCSDYWVAILDEYIDGTQSGSNYVYLMANGNYPSGASYTWTTTRQNGLIQTYAGGDIILVDASINNRIVSAEVTVSFEDCTETVSKTFDCAIPNSDANGNLFPECNGNSGGGFGKSMDSIRIHPNPVKANSRIKIEGLEAYDVYTIDIVDIFGNIKSSQNLESDSFKLNNLDTGIYFIKISTKQGVIQKKIVVN